MTVSETMVKRALDAYETALSNLPGNISAEPISVSEIRERCIRAALTAALSDQVVGGWQDISTAPHEQQVLLGWWYQSQWLTESGFASHGWSRGAISTMSKHGQATHWQPLSAPPPSSTADA